MTSSKSSTQSYQSRESTSSAYDADLGLTSEGTSGPNSASAAADGTSESEGGWWRGFSPHQSVEGASTTEMASGNASGDGSVDGYLSTEVSAWGCSDYYGMAFNFFVTFADSSPRAPQTPPPRRNPQQSQTDPTRSDTVSGTDGGAATAHTSSGDSGGWPSVGWEPTNQPSREHSEVTWDVSEDGPDQGAASEVLSSDETSCDDGYDQGAASEVLPSDETSCDDMAVADAVLGTAPVDRREGDSEYATMSRSSGSFETAPSANASQEQSEVAWNVSISAETSYEVSTEAAWVGTAWDAAQASDAESAGSGTSATDALPVSTESSPGLGSEEVGGSEADGSDRSEHQVSAWGSSGGDGDWT